MKEMYDYIQNTQFGHGDPTDYFQFVLYNRTGRVKLDPNAPFQKYKHEYDRLKYGGQTVSMILEKLLSPNN